MRSSAVSRYTYYLDIEFFEISLEPREILSLYGTTWSVILGIEVKECVWGVLNEGVGHIILC